MDPGYSYSNAGSRREWVCGYFTLRQDLQIFPEFCEYFWNCANITQTIPPNISKHFHNLPEISRILQELCQYQEHYSTQYCKIYLQISRIFQNTSGIVPISGELFHPILPAPDSAKSNQHQFSLHRVSKCHRYGS